jgi:hypothetical protein
MDEDFAIGSTITLKVEEGDCEKCVFKCLDYDVRFDCCRNIKCCSVYRKDGKNIHFVKVD